MNRKGLRRVAHGPDCDCWRCCEAREALDERWGDRILTIAAAFYTAVLLAIAFVWN